LVEPLAGLVWRRKCRQPGMPTMVGRKTRRAHDKPIFKTGHRAGFEPRPLICFYLFRPRTKDMLEANGKRIGQTLGEKSIKGRGSKPGAGRR